MGVPVTSSNTVFSSPGSSSPAAHTNVQVSLSGDDTEALKGYWAKLSEGATVVMEGSGFVMDNAEGQPDHRDQYLTDDEKAANDQFTPCCSRSRTPVLVLDL